VRRELVELRHCGESLVLASTLCPPLHFADGCSPALAGLFSEPNEVGDYLGCPAAVVRPPAAFAQFAGENRVTRI
jgi:hypothetical protein